MFLFVDKRIISKSLILFETTERVDFPIEPVDPRIAIFFFHIKILKIIKNVGKTKIIPSILSSKPP